MMLFIRCPSYVPAEALTETEDTRSTCAHRICVLIKQKRSPFGSMFCAFAELAPTIINPFANYHRTNLCVAELPQLAAECQRDANITSTRLAALKC